MQQQLQQQQMSVDNENSFIFNNDSMEDEEGSVSTSTASGKRFFQFKISISNQLIKKKFSIYFLVLHFLKKPMNTWISKRARRDSRRAAQAQAARLFASTSENVRATASTCPRSVLN